MKIYIDEKFKEEWAITKEDTEEMKSFLLDELKWSFGFRKSERDIVTGELVYEKCDTSIGKLIISPFRLLCSFGFLISVFGFALLIFPFQLLNSIKIKFK